MIPKPLVFNQNFLANEPDAPPDYPQIVDFLLRLVI